MDLEKKFEIAVIIFIMFFVSVFGIGSIILTILERKEHDKSETDY